MATSAGGRLEAKAKHYILAAAAVVTAISVVLSPARLSFFVTDAGNDNDLKSDSEVLFVTLVAQNPSRRAAVRYQSIFVDVSNSTGPQWENWMRADMLAELPLDQPRRSEKKVNATVSMVGLAGTEFTGNRTNRKFSVIVTAVVRFNVGVWTGLYDIKVYCADVDFFGNFQLDILDRAMVPIV